MLFKNAIALETAARIDTAMIPVVVAASGLTRIDTGFVPCL
jgi:hypothetical protein